MVTTRSGRAVASVSVKNVPKAVAVKAKNAAVKAINKVVKKESAKKGGRTYKCAQTCKNAKRAIATAKGYPFNVWRQAERNTPKPFNDDAAKKLFKKLYTRPKRGSYKVKNENKK